jgi:hypothetical protein
MPTTMRLIQRIVLGSDTASVTFSDIPGTYTDLVIFASARSDRASDSDPMKLRFNGASSDTSHDCRVLQGSGSSVASATETRINAGMCAGNTATTNTFGNAEAYIPNYAGSTNKSVSGVGVSETNASTVYMNVTAGLWASTAAITQIQILPVFGSNWKSASSFFLFGISKA